MFKSVVKIKESVLESIITHAREEFPNEACGYLAVKNGLITKHYEMTNVDKSPYHYTMAPAEQLAAEKNARQNEYTLCGVYHSHPHSPPYPSAEDIRLAYDSDVIYLIISLAGTSIESKAFIITAGNIVEVTLEIV